MAPLATSITSSVTSLGSFLPKTSRSRPWTCSSGGAPLLQSTFRLPSAGPGATQSLLEGSFTERSSTRSMSRRGKAAGKLTCESLNYVGAFKAACFRKYRNMVRAWRLLLDRKGVGRVSFSAFCIAARSMGFCDLRKLWAALDSNQSGFITLDKWDPEGFNILMQFKRVCRKEYGVLETAFKLGMDQTGSNTVTLNELVRFCEAVSFAGDVQVLFLALDVHEQGFITLDELDFLSRWQGERFALAPQPPLPHGIAALTSFGNMNSSLPRSPTRTQLSLQAMPELSATAAMRRRRTMQRCCPPEEDTAPTRWLVPTGTLSG